MVGDSNPILTALVNQNAASALQTKAQQLAEGEVAHWVAVIDESPYSADQWAEALHEFNGWSLNQKRELTLPHMLEYLSCCCESGMPAHLLSLPFLLQEYLRDHGVE